MLGILAFLGTWFRTLSLERFVSRFRPFGAGIINEGFTSETFSGIDDSHHLDILILIELQFTPLYSPTLALGQLSLSPTTSLATTRIPSLTIKDHIYNQCVALLSPRHACIPLGSDFRGFS
jgi:hypothetical protein